MTNLALNPVRVGLVGLGLWGIRVAEAAAVVPEVRITHCFARTQETREAFSQKYGCQSVTSYEAMLEDDSAGLLLNGLYRDRAHGGPRCGLADCLSIVAVIFGPFDEWPDVLRRDKTNSMAQSA